MYYLYKYKFFHSFGFASDLCKTVLNFFLTLCPPHLHSISNCVLCRPSKWAAVVKNWSDWGKYFHLNICCLVVTLFYVAMLVVKNTLIKLFLPILGNCWCSVVPFVAFSRNLNNFDKAVRLYLNTIFFYHE